MKSMLKNTVKFAAGVCVALGTVAVTASVVPGSKAAKVVTAGVKAAKDAMKEELETLNGDICVPAAKASPISAEEAAMFADVEEDEETPSEN